MKHLWAFVLCMGVVVPVYAQAPPTLVINTGVATVEDTPSMVKVTVERVYQDPDLVVAMAQAGNFEGRLREALNNNKLFPADIESQPPYVRSLTEGTVVAAVHLQFALPRLGNIAERVGQVTQMRRHLNSMAEALQFHYTEPLWLPENKEQMEREAVVRATEDAYRLAEAAAIGLENSIDTVDSVEILGVEWNTVPGQPNMNELSCTARVKVVYTLLQIR